MKFGFYVIASSLLATACVQPTQGSKPQSDSKSPVPDWNLEQRIARTEELVFEGHRDTCVLVRGQVNSPGIFKVKTEGKYTLAALIKDAQGFGRWAYVRRIRVTRQRDEKVDRFEIDLSPKSVESGAGNFELVPGDIIYVPEIIM